MARYPKVNDALVREVREAYDAGLKMEDIAEAVGLSYSTVYRIIRKIGAYSDDYIRPVPKIKKEKKGRKTVSLSPTQIHQALKLREEKHTWRKIYNIVNPSMSFPSFYNILTKETWDKEAYKEWVKKIHSCGASFGKLFDAPKKEELKSVEKSTPDINEIKNLIEKLKKISGAKEVTLIF